MGLYGRLFAALYDRGLRGAEEAGLGRMRHELLAGAQGSVIEVGAGTGLNLDHYPGAVSRLVLTEPETPMAERLERRAEEAHRRAEVVLCPAESLPFDDDSFDTAVTTLALCTVGDPHAALAELRRVLRPGGSLLFLEHVRSDDSAVARLQDRIDPLWRRIGHGCRCNRPTARFITHAGFRLDQIDHGRLPKAPRFVRPVITGRAVAP